MQSFKSVLQIVYYLIWIPLGVLLLALLIFLIVANPLEKLGPLGSGGPFGGPGGGFPSQEQMQQFQQQVPAPAGAGQGGPSGGGQFGPPGQ